MCIATGLPIIVGAWSSRRTRAEPIKGYDALEPAVEVVRNLLDENIGLRFEFPWIPERA